VDIDPQALQATRENALRNQITGRISVMLPQDLDAGPVDVVLANILANPLIEHAAAIAGRVGQGGYVVLTGILAAQADEVMAAYRPWFDFSAAVPREEWILLAGTRR